MCSRSRFADFSIFLLRSGSICKVKDILQYELMLYVFKILKSLRNFILRGKKLNCISNVSGKSKIWCISLLLGHFFLIWYNSIIVSGEVEVEIGSKNLKITFVIYLDLRSNKKSTILSRIHTVAVTTEQMAERKPLSLQIKTS